jgi:hypothetical protein
MAYSTIIEEFFRKACEKAGYRLNAKSGWTAMAKI